MHPEKISRIISSHTGCDYISGFLKNGARSIDSNDYMGVGCPCIGIIMNSTTDLINAEYLYKVLNETEDIGATNRILNKYNNRISVASLFSSRHYTGESISYANVAPSDFYMDGHTPIILDNNVYRKKVACGEEEVIDNNGKKYFSDLAVSLLKQYRYLNYIVSDVYLDNYCNLNFMMDIVKSLRKAFAHSTVITGAGLFSKKFSSKFIHEISISLYRIKDFIAVFDNNYTDAVGMEISLYNYVRDSGVLNNDVITSRFVFSSSRENIFTVDGSIIRQGIENTQVHIESIYNMISMFSNNKPKSMSGGG